MDEVEVGALAITVVIPERMRWTDERRGERFELQTLTVRLLADGRLATKAYGRPLAGGRAAYTAFALPPDRPDLDDLIRAGADRAADLWAAHGTVG